MHLKKTFVIALLLWLFLIPHSAMGKGPVGVVAVKSNAYREYTRIVFLLSGRTSYTLAPDLKQRKIAIEIDDSTLKLRRPSPNLRNKIVQGLTLKENPSGSVCAEIKLRSSRVEITHFLYRDPPGIVINIRKDKGSEGKKSSIKEKIEKPAKEQNTSQIREKKVTGKKKRRVVSKKKNPSTKHDLKNKNEVTDSGKDLKKEPKISRSQGDTKKENTTTIANKGPKSGPKVAGSRKDKNSAPGFSDLGGHMNTEKEDRGVDREPLSQAKKGAKELLLAGLNLHREKKHGEALEKFESLLELFPSSRHAEDASFLLGDCYFHMASGDRPGTYNSAVDAYIWALRRFPDSKRASWGAFQIGESYREMSVPYEAEAAYRRVVDQYPKSKYAPQAQLRIAESASKNHDYRGAIKEFNTYLARYPQGHSTNSAEFGIADNLAKLRDFDSALEHYRRAIKKWPEYPKTRPETLYHMGETYFENKEYRQTIDILTKLINIFPGYEFHGRALSRMGDALHMQGKVVTALNFYSAAIIRNSDDEDYWKTRLKMADVGVTKPGLSTLKGDIFDYGPYMNPLQTYEEISDRFKNSSLGNIALLKEGLFHLNHDRPIEAIPRFKQLLRDFPDSPLSRSVRLHLQDACVEAIDLYYKEHKFLSVINNYLESFDPFVKDVTDVETLLRVGLSYEKLGLNDSARKVYERVLQGKQKDDYGDLMVFKIGKLFVSDGEHEKAEQTLEGFANRFSESRYVVDVLHLVGDIRYNKGDLKKAVDAYLSALGERKGHNRETETYYYLGISLEELGRHDEAVKAYKNAILTSERHADKDQELKDFVMESYVNIGDSYYDRKRYPEALKAYIDAKPHLENDNRIFWVSFQIADCYRNIAKENEAIQTLQESLNESDDEFWKKVFFQAIDGINWKKRIRDLLH